MSAGGIVALVLLIAFSLVLMGSCIYQSRRRKSEEVPQHRVLRCGGCRRAFRVPISVEGAEFMCSRCVTEGRRRMSEVLEEERVARFSKMRESANKTVKLKRLTSTFFKLTKRSQSNLESTGTSKIHGDSVEPSFVEDGKVAAEGSNECKICFDDENCIVLLPCCHSGLCEGCAKDLVTMTKECYICRQEIELLAKIRRPAKGISTTGSQILDDHHLSACLMAPDALHHLTSRQNTFEDGMLPGVTRRGAQEDGHFEPPTLDVSMSRRNTLHALDAINRPETIDEEPTTLHPLSVDAV